MLIAILIPFTRQRDSDVALVDSQLSAHLLCHLLWNRDNFTLPSSYEFHYIAYFTVVAEIYNFLLNSLSVYYKCS